jgi:hypothetical protein
MRNRLCLRLDSLVLFVVLFVGASACTQAAPPIATPAQATPPGVSSPIAAVPRPSVAASPVASPVAIASPSPLRAAANAAVVVSPSASPSVSAAAAAPRPSGVSLMFTAPTAGETVSAGSVTVTVSYTGPAMVAAANATKLDDYHVHYFLDVDPTPYIGTLAPIPLGDPRIIHSPATSVTFDNVVAGTHTLAVVMTGSNHVSGNPPMADKETFTTR